MKIKLPCKVCELSKLNEVGCTHNSFGTTSLGQIVQPLGLGHQNGMFSLPQLRDFMLAAYLLSGYYQPAGPLITVPLGHGQPPLTKSAPLSEISPTPSPLSSHPPHPAPSSNGDSSDSEVIITSVTAGKDVPPPPQAHTSFRYSQYHPNLPPQNYTHPYSSPYYHSTPPPSSYTTHDMCYPSGPYIHHKFPPTTYRRYMGGPQYYPSNPTTQDIYAIPPSHGQPSQQVATSTPASASGNYPQPPSTLLEPYPPTIVEAYPTHYYPGYHPPGPPSTCYSHAPPSRAVPFLNGVYQNCPCPMQSCPKNGLTGPLTGESKRSSTLPKGGIQPLPPVALALPKEPTSDGPPSPARGSAGMPPPPSPAGATYQQPTPPATKQENTSSENEIANKRKARIGKAMVRNNMQNTMLLMCNPLPVNCVKREIESPKEKEAVTVPEKNDNALNETKANILPQPDILVTSFESIQKEELKPSSVKTEEKPKEVIEDQEKLEPVINTVAENVKMKNMKRKLSVSSERKEEIPVSPKKQKTDPKTGSSYKNLIKKNTSSITINNGKRKLIQESKSPELNINSRKKRQLNPSKEQTIKKTKQQLLEEMSNNNNNSIKQKCNNMEHELENIVESKENLTKGNVPIQSAKSNQKLTVKTVDKLLAKNSIDRTIDCVINDSIRTNGVPKKTDKVKCAKELLVPNVVSAKKNTKLCSKNSAKRKKSKCKEPQDALVTVRTKPTLKWSNGWSWEGEPYEAKVFLNSDETTVIRTCYPSMRHYSGDLIEIKDCVLLKAGARRNELPFVAKIAALWENPEDGEMMMSLLWFYRPEHTEQGRQPIDRPDEVFASRHKDSNSVACIDDKCYVLTYNEYCRYRKILRRQEEGIEEEAKPSIPVPEPYPRSHRQPPYDTKISPEMIFFCRRVYDFRQKRIIKNPT